MYKGDTTGTVIYPWFPAISLCIGGKCYREFYYLTEEIP